MNTIGATGNASLTNNLAGDLVLGTSTVGGVLTVVSSLGNLTQTGVLTVGTTSSFTTSAADATITLNSANLLTGAASLNTDGADRQRQPDQRQGHGARGIERRRQPDGDG